MENKTKHHATFIIKSFLIIAILLFKYNKAVTLITDSKRTIKSFTNIIIAIIAILFLIINLDISSHLDFNTEVSTYINIFYIFIILTLGIILNYLDDINKNKKIALLIFFILVGLIILFLIDGLLLKRKISNWILTNKSNNNNEDEDLKERSILLLDEGLNYILFFVFLYIFLQAMTYIIENNILKQLI